MITITLPLPPVALSPNARHHWAVKARATKAYRRQAEMAARMIPARRREAWTHAEARATFYLPTKRTPDRDNLAASLKAAWDGLTDAGVLADDRDLTHLPLGRKYDRTNPRVELEIRPLAA